MSPRPHPLPRPSQHARHWGLDPGVVFLNHGSFGACPTKILEQQRELQARLEREPIRFFVEDLEGVLDGVRHALGRFMNADPDGFVRMTNATEGVNTVVRSLRFQPGDELLTNSHEYNACNNVLRHAAEQWGARVVNARVPWPIRNPQQAVDAVLGSLTPRTKLVLLSHITSPTGLVFPIEKIVRELNAWGGRGVDALIDGAHAPGMVPLDLNALDAPYYSGNCHKWMCAPKGSAFLWVRKDRRHLMRPLTISHGANSTRDDRPKFRVEFDYTGTADVTPFLVLPELITFMDTLVPRRADDPPHAWASLMRHNRENTLRGRDILCRELRVTSQPAPDDMLASLASVPIPDRTLPKPGEALPVTKYHDPIQDRLIANWGIQAPIVLHPPGDPTATQRAVRIAMQCYNSLEQVEYLARAVKQELA